LNPRHILKTFSSVSLLLLFSKLITFLRDPIIAKFYGASSYSDSFFIAYNISNFIFAPITVIAMVGFIPVLGKLVNKNDETKINEFVSKILQLFIGGTLLILIIGILFISKIIAVFAPGLDIKTFDLVKYSALLLLPSSLLLVLSALLTSIFYLYNSFVLPNVIKIISGSVTIILIIFLLPYLKIFSVPFATLLGCIIQFVLTYMFFLKITKIKIVITKEKILNAEIKNSLRLSLTLIINTILFSSLTYIFIYFSSYLSKGTYSLISYATKIFQIPMDVFILGFTTVIYPIISKTKSENDKAKFLQEIQFGFDFGVLFLIPLSFMLYLFSSDLIKIIYFRGAFILNSVSYTTKLLNIFSIGIIGIGMLEYLTRVYYVLDFKRNTIIAYSIIIISDVILSFIIVPVMEAEGLVLSYSISLLLGSNFLLLVLHYSHKLVLINYKLLFYCFLSSVLSSCFVIYLRNFFTDITQKIGILNNLITFFFLGLVFVTSYLLILKLLKVNYIVKFFHNYLRPS